MPESDESPSVLLLARGGGDERGGSGGAICFICRGSGAEPRPLYRLGQAKTQRRASVVREIGARVLRSVARHDENLARIDQVRIANLAGICLVNNRVTHALA